jgi:hypothetical membrane protein
VTEVAAPTSADRLALLCGIAGPAAFVSAWAVAGARRDGYDPVSTTISRLAEQGASTRPLMSAGMVTFGVLVPVFARALGRATGSRAVTTSVTVAGLATVGVALTPLSLEGGTAVDVLHAVAAGTGYLAMAVTPALAARTFRPGPVRTASYAVTAVSAAGLVASLLVPDVAGLGQRVGLTVVDAWFAATAVALLRRARIASRP